MAVSNEPVLTALQRKEVGLAWVDRTARLLDTQFRIPGTEIRFGLDFLVGLLPVIGDGISLLLSGGLLLIIARYGVSGRLFLRMLANVGLDALVGTIPFIGDLFDLTYRANYRNLLLLREHYEEGKHAGSAWPFLIGLLLTVLLVLAAMIYAMYYLLYTIGSSVLN